MKYEFSEEQNEGFQGLAQAMMFVALILGVIGLVGSAALLWVSRGQAGTVPHLVETGSLLLLGAALFAAARRFQAIVSTRGSDVEHLMGALGWLRRAYWVEVAVILLALTLNGYAVWLQVGARS